jgi:hypothetical protein
MWQKLYSTEHYPPDDWKQTQCGDGNGAERKYLSSLSLEKEGDVRKPVGKGIIHAFIYLETSLIDVHHNHSVVVLSKQQRNHFVAQRCHHIYFRVMFQSFLGYCTFIT